MLTLRGKTAVAWIALVAVLYSAATPLLSALRADPRTDYFGMLCTMAGIKAAPAQPAVPSGGGNGRQQHCIFCVSGAWQPPLEVSLKVPVPDAAGVAVLPARDPVLPHSFALLESLSPRAPPRLV